MKGVSAYNRNRFLARKIQTEPAASGYSEMRQSFSSALTVLMCMAALVLLIACFNVANLMIARAVSRQKEVAVRLAIGASRWQLLRQLLIESLVLSLAGGAVGLFLSVAIIRGLLHYLPGSSSTLMLRAAPDLRILAFNGVLALLTGVFFGLAPALQSLKVDLWNTLKDVVGAVSGGGGSVRLRKTLVTAQVAFSFLLLVGSGLFVRTLANLKQTNPGFQGLDNLVTFQVDPALSGYSLPRLQSFYRQLLDKIRTTPGVKSAGFAMVPVLIGGEWDSTMSVEGHKNQDNEDNQAYMNCLSVGYWKTMGVPLVAGRDFDDRDAGKDFTAAIVNRKFATHFFGDKSPLGRHVGFGDGPKTKLNIEIVGVTEDSLYEGPREGVHRQALGAPRGQVIWMVMRETMVLVAAGLAIGIPAALAVSKYVSTQLFGVKATDIASAAAALIILAVVAAGAGFLPARRASSIDPIQALRYE